MSLTPFWFWWGIAMMSRGRSKEVGCMIGCSLGPMDTGWGPWSVMDMGAGPGGCVLSYIWSKCPGPAPLNPLWWPMCPLPFRMPLRPVPVLTTGTGSFLTPLPASRTVSSLLGGPMLWSFSRDRLKKPSMEGSCRRPGCWGCGWWWWGGITGWPCGTWGNLAPLPGRLGPTLLNGGKVKLWEVRIAEPLVRLPPMRLPNMESPGGLVGVAAVVSFLAKPNRELVMEGPCAPGWFGGIWGSLLFLVVSFSGFCVNGKGVWGWWGITWSGWAGGGGWGSLLPPDAGIPANSLSATKLGPLRLRMPLATLVDALSSSAAFGGGIVGICLQRRK